MRIKGRISFCKNLWRGDLCGPSTMISRCYYTYRRSYSRIQSYDYCRYPFPRRGLHQEGNPTGWKHEIEEINQELEEICGSFSEPFTNIDSHQNSAASGESSPSFLPRTEADVPSLKHEQANHPHSNTSLKSTLIPTQTDQTRNILLIHKYSTLNSSSCLLSSLPSSYNLNISSKLWDGSLTSLLNIVSPSSHYDSVVVVDENPHVSITEECSQVLQLLHRSCPVVKVNQSPSLITTITSINLQQGISVALGMPFNQYK